MDFPINLRQVTPWSSSRSFIQRCSRDCPSFPSLDAKYSCYFPGQFLDGFCKSFSKDFHQATNATTNIPVFSPTSPPTNLSCFFQLINFLLFIKIVYKAFSRVQKFLQNSLQKIIGYFSRNFLKNYSWISFKITSRSGGISP